MNRTATLLIFGLMAFGLISCQPSPEDVEDVPVPVLTEVPASEPKVERFSTTPLVTSSIDGRVKTALIVDNQTGCIMTMVAPNGPRPMMVDGKWAGCEEQPVPAVIPDRPAAPEVAQ